MTFIGKLMIIKKTPTKFKECMCTEIYVAELHF